VFFILHYINVLIHLTNAFSETKLFHPNGHSLSDYVKDIRRAYHNKLKERNAITDEDIQLIIYGDEKLALKGNEKLKALAEMGFCFEPPHPKSVGACGCRHCKGKHYR